MQELKEGLVIDTQYQTMDDLRLETEDILQDMTTLFQSLGSNTSQVALFEKIQNHFFQAKSNLDTMGSYQFRETSKQQRQKEMVGGLLE